MTSILLIHFKKEETKRLNKRVLLCLTAPPQRSSVTAWLHGYMVHGSVLVPRLNLHRWTTPPDADWWQMLE